MKSGCLLPVYGHFSTLLTLLPAICQYFSVNDIFIVNDGCPYFDLEKLKALYPDVHVIIHEKNSGKGAALLSGLKKMHKLNYDFALCMDADGQHDPGKIPSFMEKLGEAEIIIGNRMDDISSMPLSRRMSNTITSAMIRFISDLPVKDSQNGFRLLKIDKILELRLREPGFQFESEMLLAAGEKGLQIENIPVKTIYNQAGSSIHHLYDTLRFIRLVLRFLLRRKNKSEMVTKVK